MSGLPERPLLKPWYRRVVEPQRVLLEYGNGVVYLEGRALERLVPALLPLVDGSRTVDEIVAAIGVSAEPAVRHALELLHAHGLLTDGPAAPPGAARETAALIAAQSRGLRSVAAAAGALSSETVAVVGEGALARDVVRLLRRSGIAPLRGSLADPPAAALVVVAPAPGEAAALAGWNEDALERVQPWLQVLGFDGRIAAVGPLFLPGETCCYECYRARRASTVEYARDYLRIDEVACAAPRPPVLAMLVASIAALHAIRWIGGRDPALPGVLFAVELEPSVSVTAHRVLRVPRCAACSPARGLAPPLPWHEHEAVA